MLVFTFCTDSSTMSIRSKWGAIVKNTDKREKICYSFKKLGCPPVPVFMYKIYPYPAPYLLAILCGRPLMHSVQNAAMVQQLFLEIIFWRLHLSWKTVNVILKHNKGNPHVGCFSVRFIFIFFGLSLSRLLPKISKHFPWKLKYRNVNI